MAKNESKVKKVIKTLAVLGVAAGVIFGGYHIVQNLDIGTSTQTPQTQQLSVVQNVTYDESNYIFSWDPVENADKYVVNINGEDKNVDTNAYFHIPTEGVTEFKVKAVDTTGVYTSSDWSEVYTHNAKQTTDLYSSVNMFLSDILVGKDLKEIIGMYANGNTLYTQVVCEYNGEEYFHNMRIKYDTEITSIEQVMELKEDAISIIIGMGSEVVDYNSIEFLLKSNSYDGILETYRLDGYDISVVSSQTVKMDGSDKGEAFRIYGTYKLEKNGEVKYVQVELQCEIVKPHSNPATNYTLKLQNVNDRDVYQLSYKELTGEFVEFAEKMEKVNGTAQQILD